jgi:sugar-specific transcriptional regulator TrmB|tara:strand:- start:2527 stop:3357 length:831 start_codon:yes stop_codon:yes gene_type:complete
MIKDLLLQLKKTQREKNKMLIKQDLINKIKDYFNLNIYETKIWLALLKKGIATAGEVAVISGVPRSRAYDVLESLEKRGFAIVKLDKPIKYLGVKPRVIVEKLKNNVMRNAEEKIVELSGIKKTEEFSKLESLYKMGLEPIKKEDISFALKGKSNISNHIKEIIKNAEKEVIICTNAEELISKQRLFNQTFDVLGKAGVKIKIALSGSDGLLKQVEDKFEIKFTKININAKFFIIDRKEILFHLSKDQSEDDIAVWLNSEFFAQAFASLFERALKL